MQNNCEETSWLQTWSSFQSSETIQTIHPNTYERTYDYTLIIHTPFQSSERFFFLMVPTEQNGQVVHSLPSLSPKTNQWWILWSFDLFQTVSMLPRCLSFRMWHVSPRAPSSLTLQNTCRVAPKWHRLFGTEQPHRGPATSGSECRPGIYVSTIVLLGEWYCTCSFVFKPADVRIL